MLTNNAESMKHEHRASASSYVVFGCIIGTPLLILTIATLRHPSSSLVRVVLGCIAALAFAFVWLSRFRLIISPEEISYSSLFRSERTVRREDIAAAGFARRTGPFESPYTFVIQSRSGTAVRINAKVFSRAALVQLGNLETK